VTNVTKHSPRAVISPGISIFIQKKHHFNVTKHSTRAIIL
jgi:hypothetical protein